MNNDELAQIMMKMKTHYEQMHNFGAVQVNGCIIQDHNAMCWICKNDEYEEKIEDACWRKGMILGYECFRICSQFFW